MIDVQPLMHTVDMSRVDRTKGVMIPLLEPEEIESKNLKQTTQSKNI